MAIRVGAALDRALDREAIRQALAKRHGVEPTIVTSTAAGVVGARGSDQLDLIVISTAVPDADSVIRRLIAGPLRSKLLVVDHPSKGGDHRSGLRAAQVLAAPLDADSLASIVSERAAALGAPATGAGVAKTDHADAARTGPVGDPANRGLGSRPAMFKRREIVVLGCSTGGPEALAVLLRQLPEEFPVPIVLVQHMPSDFTTLLAERLNRSSTLVVREITGPTKARAGEVWIAPGDKHVKIARVGGHLELDDGPEENNCKPAVDVLFRSAAATYGRRAVGVVLTGMGDDGCRGGRTLAESGAYMIAQDEATSVVWGMPGAISRAGIADAVVPLSGIAAEICNQFASGKVEATQ